MKYISAETNKKQSSAFVLRHCIKVMTQFMIVTITPGFGMMHHLRNVYFRKILVPCIILLINFKTTECKFYVTEILEGSICECLKS